MTKILWPCLVDTPWYVFLHPETNSYVLFTVFGPYHCFTFTFRVGATRNVRDSRDHGHKTLSFSTTLISSNICFSPSFLWFRQSLIGRVWIRSSWWLLLKQRDTKRRERRASSTANRQGSSPGSYLSSTRWEICCSKLYKLIIITSYISIRFIITDSAITVLRMRMPSSKTILKLIWSCQNSGK